MPTPREGGLHRWASMRGGPFPVVTQGSTGGSLFRGLALVKKWWRAHAWACECSTYHENDNRVEAERAHIMRMIVVIEENVLKTLLSKTL